MAATRYHQSLSDNLTCSICLHMLTDPVSIHCGHSFCRECISTYCQKRPDLRCRCPDCRDVFQESAMRPVIRLKNVVEHLEAMRMDTVEPWAPGEPLQLVGVDENGRIIFNEEVLRSCLQRKELESYPVCVISIIGQQRLGKSFLMNYLIRKLQNLEKRDDSWMGEKELALSGFQWKPGHNCITKGVWLWSKPFPMDSNGEKIVVYLMDTEGSLSLEGDKETTVKLSAFSMLLSSYLIFNVSKSLDESALEYMEMFLEVAKDAADAFFLNVIQQWDILVRDWFYPKTFGVQAGQTYLEKVKETLAQPPRHPQTLQTLRSTSTRCFLMPFPGDDIAGGSGGAVQDMSVVFKEQLQEYISSLVTSAGGSVKMDRNSCKLTCGKLAKIIKEVVALMKREYGFSSPAQMRTTLRNYQAKEELKAQYQQFIKQQDRDFESMIKVLKMNPKKMRGKLSEKIEELLELLRDRLEGETQTQQDSLEELKSEMERDTEEFVIKYKKRFRNKAIAAGVAGGVATIGIVGAGAGVVVGGLLAGAIVSEIAAIGGMAGAGLGAGVGAGGGAGVGAGVGASLSRKTGEGAGTETPEGRDASSGDDASDEAALL